MKKKRMKLLRETAEVKKKMSMETRMAMAAETTVAVREAMSDMEMTIIGSVIRAHQTVARMAKNDNLDWLCMLLGHSMMS